MPPRGRSGAPRALGGSAGATSWAFVGAPCVEIAPHCFQDISFTVYITYHSLHNIASTTYMPFDLLPTPHVLHDVAQSS
eukprot:2341671-Pyramimonas_sp.AAC.1